MKTIITGSRHIYPSIHEMNSIIKRSEFRITQVVSGHSGGVDRAGENWATREKLPIFRFHANWNVDGKMAGLLRNRKMVEYADALIAVWDGKSTGTADVIREAKAKGLKVFVWNWQARAC
jgi:hypothetical protein